VKYKHFINPYSSGTGAYSNGFLQNVGRNSSTAWFAAASTLKQWLANWHQHSKVWVLEC
jgi:hypothetical protein